MANVTITQGTQTSIRTTTISANDYQHVVLNEGTSADQPFTGTLKAGTVSMTTGTLNGGTLTNLVSGTVSTLGLTHANAWATVVSTGTNTLGTIKPAVSGSSIYVTDLIVSVGSATNVEIASGGTSTGLIGTMYFNANGGAVVNFRTPIFTASGSALVYKQSTAVSPMSITAQGYVK